MKTQALPGILVLFFAAACQREKSGGASSPQGAQPAANVAAQGTDGGGDGAIESQVAREKGRKFKKRMDAAKEAFGKRDLPAALAELEAAEGIDGNHVELLTLRGACHVETRDFTSALADFSAAVEKAPGNGHLHFNRGEVLFVTDQWAEAIKAFRLAKEHLFHGSESVMPLIDFKLMLCEAGRGDQNAFERLAEANQASPDPQLAAFTRVARALEAQDQAAAADALAATKASVPDAADRAPWYDSMLEFGYQVPLEERRVSVLLPKEKAVVLTLR